MHGFAGKAAGCCHLASGGNPCPAQELDPGGGGDDDISLLVETQWLWALKQKRNAS